MIKVQFFSNITVATLLMSLLTPLLVLVPKASAVTDTCTWVGGTDTNFSTAANWSCSIDGIAIPENGDDIVLDLSALTQNETLNNDIVSLSLSGISVINTSANFYSYTLNGNSIDLTGDISVNSGFLDIEFDLTASAPDLVISSLLSTGSLNIGSNSITLIDSRFDGAISGTGTVTFDSVGGGGKGGGCKYGVVPVQFPFKGDNSSFSGGIILNGNVSLSIDPNSTTIARHASSIVVNSANAGLQFYLSNGIDSTFDKDITFNGGFLRVNQYFKNDVCDEPDNYKTLTLTGTVIATANVNSYLDYANIKMTGTVTGQDFFTVPEGQSAAGSFTIGSTVKESAVKETKYSGDQSGTNPYVSANNIAIVEAGATLGNVVVDGGTLKGVGTTGNIDLINGSVAPGLSPGCLSSGNLTYTGGSLDIEIAGTTVCTEYDQQQVTGTVNLGSATTLNVSFLNSFTPAVNDAFMIINNDVADAVTGTFNGLADGATFEVSGVTFQINYNGGDGNDVMLLVTSVTTPGAPDTGIANILANPYLTIFTAIATLGMMAGLRYSESKNKL